MKSRKAQNLIIFSKKLCWVATCLVIHKPVLVLHSCCNNSVVSVVVSYLILLFFFLISWFELSFLRTSMSLPPFHNIYSVWCYLHLNDGDLVHGFIHVYFYFLKEMLHVVSWLMFTAKLDGDVAPPLFFATWYIRLLILLNVDWLIIWISLRWWLFNSFLVGAIQTNDTCWSFWTCSVMQAKGVIGFRTMESMLLQKLFYVLKAHNRSILMDS